MPTYICRVYFLCAVCYDGVEIRTDDANSASWKVAERAGFTLEALLRGDSLTPLGEVRSTRVYARVRGIEEPLGGSVAK